MIFSLIILAIVLALQTSVDASTLTLNRVTDMFHIGINAEHFAIYARAEASPTRVVAVNGNKIIITEATCKTEIHDANERRLNDYIGLRNAFMRKANKSPAMVTSGTRSYAWSEAISEDEKGFSVTRLDDETVVYASKLFPSKLARIIISGNLYFFVHYDGYSAIKEGGCLLDNEKILIEGVRKIKTTNNQGFISCFHQANDSPLKKHLKVHPINEAIFEREQTYSKTN